MELLVKEIIKEIQNGAVFEQIMIFRSAINGELSSWVDTSEVEKLSLELKSLFSRSEYKIKCVRSSISVGFKSEGDTKCLNFPTPVNCIWNYLI